MLNKYSAIRTLAAALIGIQTPAFADSVSPASNTVSLTFAHGAAWSGWLDFEYYGGTRIFVPVHINGRQVMVMLDSGASETVLDKRFAALIGLHAQGNMAGGGAGGGGAYGALNGVDVVIGALTLRGGAAVAVDLAAVERQLGHTLPVILGGDVFRDAVVDIDFQRHRIAFLDPKRFTPPPNAVVAPLTASDDNKAIKAMVEGRPATLLFDLGNGSALSLFPRFWDQPGFLTGRPLSTTMTGGWGGMSVQKLAIVRELSLGGVAFRHLPAVLERDNSQDARAGKLDGNVGIRVLSRFHLIIDYPQQKVFFDPPADVATPFDINHSGLTTEPEADGAKILYVAPKSPAAAAGLKIGDEIRSIDDEAGIKTKPFSNDWLSAPVGECWHIHLSDGQVRMMKMAEYF